MSLLIETVMHGSGLLYLRKFCNENMMFKNMSF